MTHIKPIVNIAGYLFFDLKNPETYANMLENLCQQAGLIGTILIAPEGINLNLAGDRQQVDQFLSNLPEPVSKINFKESYSAEVPFKRLRIKCKDEIIRMGVDHIKPQHDSAPRLAPEILKTWLDQGQTVHLLDTRNQFEFELGSFANAISLNIETFSDFPDAINQLPAETKQQPMVTFCTGGIRCEKAALLMQEAGFEQVYQLDGGILSYLEQCGGAHWEGDCFVFDERIALDSQLEANNRTAIETLDASNTGG